MTISWISFVLFPGQSSFQETLCYQKPVVAIPVTGKSLSEALILGSTNPQYHKREWLFIDLPVQYMKTTSSEHGVYENCFCIDNSEQFMYKHVLSL